MRIGVVCHCSDDVGAERADYRLDFGGREGVRYFEGGEVHAFKGHEPEVWEACQSCDESYGNGNL